MHTIMYSNKKIFNRIYCHFILYDVEVKLFAIFVGVLKDFKYENQKQPRYSVSFSDSKHIPTLFTFTYR